MRTRRANISSGYRETRDWLELARSRNAAGIFLMDINSLHDYVYDGSNLSLTTATRADGTYTQGRVVGPNSRVGYELTDSFNIGFRSSDYFFSSSGFTIEFFFKMPSGGTGISTNLCSTFQVNANYVAMSNTEYNGIITCTGGSVNQSFTGYDDEQWHHFVRGHNKLTSTEYIMIDNVIKWQGASSRTYTNHQVIIGFTGSSPTPPLFSGALSSCAVYNEYLFPNRFIYSLGQAEGPEPRDLQVSILDNLGEVGPGTANPTDLTINLESLITDFDLRIVVDYIDIEITPIADGNYSYPGVLVDRRLGGSAYSQTNTFWVYDGPVANTPSPNYAFYIGQNNYSGTATAGGFKVADGPQTIRVQSTGSPMPTFDELYIRSMSGGTAGSVLNSYEITRIEVGWGSGVLIPDPEPVDRNEYFALNEVAYPDTEVEKDIPTLLSSEIEGTVTAITRIDWTFETATDGTLTPFCGVLAGSTGGGSPAVSTFDVSDVPVDSWENDEMLYVGVTTLSPPTIPGFTVADGVANVIQYIDEPFTEGALGLYSSAWGVGDHGGVSHRLIGVRIYWTELV